MKAWLLALLLCFSSAHAGPVFTFITVEKLTPRYVIDEDRLYPPGTVSIEYPGGEVIIFPQAGYSRADEAVWVVKEVLDACVNRPKHMLILGGVDFVVAALDELAATC